jgi:hypothetical protein
MIFYLVPAAAGRPATLQPTQADANREARERGLKVRAPDMEHQVPTDKAGLMAYVNAMLAEQPRAMTRDEIVNSNAPEAQAAAEAAMNPDTPSYVETNDDGSLKVRTAFTCAQVAASALPKDTKVQDICHAIAKLRANELGYVALEVIARGARLGGFEN